MSFIKIQALKLNAEGQISSGSASITDSVYDKNAKTGHSRQVIRERLGKVLYLAEDRKSGIFLSPTRGVVEYSSVTDEFVQVESCDKRIHGIKCFPVPDVHTVFGDAHLLALSMHKTGMIDVLAKSFPEKEWYTRILCHTMHNIIKDGSRITCDNFLARSFLSHILTNLPQASLRSDSRFFSHMGLDKVKMSFFTNFVATMRAADSAFGHGCYVDSTPLPNDIDDNPFNALCCHGIGSSAVMSRLVLVLDEKTGLPIWFDVIPGNVLDVNSLQNIMEDVSKNLNVDINEFVLDAGYVSQELLNTFNCDNGCGKSLIARMPGRKGFPAKELYRSIKPLIGRGKYAFVRERHTYFGHRKLVNIAGHEIYAYVYIDKTNATTKFADYLVNHQTEFDKLSMADKDWTMDKFGFFVLLSTKKKAPREILDEYFERATIEGVFKTSKDYLQLLPLAKWDAQKVKGKLLHDIICTICLLKLRKDISSHGVSVSEVFGKGQALMCHLGSCDQLTVETPSKQLKSYYAMIGFKVPTRINIVDFAKDMLSVKM